MVRFGNQQLIVTNSLIRGNVTCHKPQINTQKALLCDTHRTLLACDVQLFKCITSTTTPLGNVSLMVTDKAVSHLSDWYTMC